MVPSELAGWNVARAVAVIPVREDVGSYWIKIALEEPAVRELIYGRLNTTVQATLNLKDVGQLPILMPSKDERETIAAVIGKLDNKIELNRRMSQTLEAIARAIFKSWFVDFEPVVEMARGQAHASVQAKYGLSVEAMATLPVSMSTNQGAPLPRGWMLRPLSEVTRYLNRGISPKYVDEGGTLVLNQKCIRNQQVSIKEGRRHDQAQRSIEGRLLQVGDILVNSTGVGTLGRVAQVMTLKEPTIVDSHVTVVRADAQKVTANYLGMALFARQSDIEALGEGSTGQTELSRARLAAMPVLVPPPELLVCFDKHTAGLRQQIAQLADENQALEKTRDALLPQLLSGKLHVSQEAVE